MKNFKLAFFALSVYSMFVFGLCTKAADIIQVSDKRSFDYSLTPAPAGDQTFSKSYANNIDSVLNKNGLSSSSVIQSVTLNTVKLTLDDNSKITFDDVSIAELKINGDALIATVPAKGSPNRTSRSITLTNVSPDITKYINAANITFQMHLATTAANPVTTPLHVFVDYTISVNGI